MGAALSIIVPGLGLLAVMTVCWRLGVALHRRAGAGGETGGESYVLSGAFGLLALLMAFAFSLAIGRYETRRLLVVEEANAIGTMATRLALLEDAQRQPLKASLARYAAERAAVGKNAEDDAWQAAHEASSAACARFGDDLFALLRSVPPDTRGPVLVQAYNAMCDITTARHAARSARLPTEVLGLLALYCCACTALLGFTTGRADRRSAVSSVLFFSLLAAAYATILDLDSPRSGAIIVPQEELDKVAQGLG
ncbi:hypothetical protein NSE01_01350 [Novosphingobium sediminis]|uniref:DUF4239 domain-containing protein n=1 Tax=Novosphingobium sediminis TaxID=707214 RepID=A0A512AF73_9SPHN|nr:hypothetical protein NSE01_01350 [Novosphingobium sediminis]